MTETKKLPSLVELSNTENTGPKIVLNVFGDYARSGAAINPLLIKKIVDKANFNRGQLIDARNRMLEGFVKQEKRQDEKASLEYKQATTYIEGKLARMQWDYGQTFVLPKNQQL